MRIFMNYDSGTGEITGLYVDQLWPISIIPTTAIEITEDAWQKLIPLTASYKVDITKIAAAQTPIDNIQDYLVAKPVPENTFQPDDWQQRIMNLENLQLQQEGLI